VNRILPTFGGWWSFALMAAVETHFCMASFADAGVSENLG